MKRPIIVAWIRSPRSDEVTACHVLCPQTIPCRACTRRAAVHAPGGRPSMSWADSHACTGRPSMHASGGLHACNGPTMKWMACRPCTGLAAMNALEGLPPTYWAASHPCTGCLALPCGLSAMH
eukprot:357661-Chlamydomonas_euryale.AAC.2